jgi:hypothetical protein
MAEPSIPARGIVASPEALLLAILTTPAFAFAVSGFDWAWQSAPVEEPFELNMTSFSPVATPEEVEPAYIAAQRIWNTEGHADLLYAYQGDTTATQQGNGDDGHDVMVYGQPNTGGGLAVSTATFIGEQLLDCDIQVWRRNGYGLIAWHFGPGPAPAGTYDFQQTATHELGHCLGLAHTNVEGAIMYPYNLDGTGDEARHLLDDDIAGLQSIYGPVGPELSAEWTLADTDGNGIPNADEAFSISADLTNEGDGSAFDVVAMLEGEGPIALPDPVDIGDIGAATDVGGRVGPSVVTVPFPLSTTGCTEDGPIHLVLTLGDGAGTTWTTPIDFDVDCAPDPVDTDGGGGNEHPPRQARGGCSCAASPSSAPPVSVAWLGALAVLSWRTRTRALRPRGQARRRSP